MSDLDAILIAGPTASGKSSLALNVAKSLGGAVINADSMQVYDALGILTARPSEEDERSVPHRLYGFVPAGEAYSVGRWVEDVVEALAWAKGEGLLPIIVGGTGLYFSALLEGLSPIPDIAEDVRAKWRAKGKEHSGPDLHEMLRGCDPGMAERLRPTDKQRLVRALEVFDATGKSLAYWQEQPGTPVLDFSRVRAFVVAPEREVLYARCNWRLEHMVAHGVLEEVKALGALDLDEDLPVMRALGVQPFLQHLAGEADLDDALERSKMDTRRYAKRQMTWLKGNMMSWKWLSAQEMESFKRDTIAFLDD